MKILVIDDEQPARKKLISFIKESLEDVNIYEASNGIEAVEKIGNEKYDLIFLDIQMPGMTGFEVIEHVGVENMPAVVFVTAYDQYALDAFEVNAVDYLLKPFDKNRFNKSLDKAYEKLIIKKSTESELKNILKVINKTKKIAERFLVSHGSKYFFVQAEDIIYVSAEEKYVSLHTNTCTYLLRETMTKMEEKLNPEKFTRIHRSFIVNIQQIQEMQPWSHGDYLVILKNGEKINMSRRYRDNLFDKKNP